VALHWSFGLQVLPSFEGYKQRPAWLPSSTGEPARRASALEFFWDTPLYGSVSSIVDHVTEIHLPAGQLAAGGFFSLSLSPSLCAEDGHDQRPDR
jgi:hypothetical protein